MVPVPPGVIFISTHNYEHEIFSRMPSCLWNMALSQGAAVTVQMLVCLPLLIVGKLLFWSRPYMEISCVVNCLAISFWRAYLFWVCNANEAKPIIPATNTSNWPSPTSLRWRLGLRFHSFPISDSHEVLRIRARLRSCFHGDAAIRANKVPITVFKHFRK